jgi:putative transcriptional regulator
MTMKKRDLFKELTEGFDALADRRAGKRTLRTHTVKARPAPRISARELARIRKDMNLSRGLSPGICAPTFGRLKTGNRGEPGPMPRRRCSSGWCSDSRTRYSG